MDGRVLGAHKGVIHYTIGQRRGLGIGGLSEPLYVVKLDPHAQVVVGPKAALATRTVPVKEVNWTRRGFPRGRVPRNSRTGPFHAPAPARDPASDRRHQAQQNC